MLTSLFFQFIWLKAKIGNVLLFLFVLRPAQCVCMLFIPIISIFFIQLLSDVLIFLKKFSFIFGVLISQLIATYSRILVLRICISHPTPSPLHLLFFCVRACFITPVFRTCWPILNTIL